MFPDTSNIAWKPDTRQRQLVKVEWSTMGPHRKIRTRVPNGTSSKLVGGVQSQSGPEFEQYNNLNTKYNHKQFPHVYSTRTATRNPTRKVPRIIRFANNSFDPHSLSVLAGTPTKAGRFFLV
jgi:hypothetical protein